MDERRNSQRHRTLKSGKIIYNRGLFAIDCTVKNISETGACLLTQTTSLPDKFDLSIPVDHFEQPCIVKWKTADKIGVEFIKAA